MSCGYGVSAAPGVLDNLLVHRGVKYETVLPQTGNLSMAQHVAHTNSEHPKHKLPRCMYKNASSKYAS